MENEQRKASEVLLELEQKLNTALSIIRTQDMNIKILSNKLNNIIELLEKQNAPAQKIVVEAVNNIPNFPQVPTPTVPDQIPILAELKLPVEDSPKGFRRTSRPETFAGDNSYLPKSSSDLKKFPTQIPKQTIGKMPNNTPPPGREPTSEIIVPSPPQAPVTVKPNAKNQNIVQNAIPVSQRVVNKDGKSLYLANVEIIDLQTMQPVFKSRTNGTGKWSAALPIGSYRVIIVRRESTSGEKFEATQDIHIDGSESKVDLQTIIIKA